MSERVELKGGCSMRLEEFEPIGTVFVDSGQIMVGDPCYVLPREDGDTAIEGRTYDALLAAYGEDWDRRYLIPFEHGIAAVVSSGYGDGQYTVYVRYENGGEWGKRVAQVMIDFVGDMEPQEEDDDGYLWPS